jgi:hypothetical protein
VKEAAVAICRACEGDMSVVFTCRAEERPLVSRYGEDMPADEYDPAAREFMASRCRDCGVVWGGVHHPFCVVAACRNPVHEWEQRVLCDCDDVLEDQLDDDEVPGGWPDLLSPSSDSRSGE